MRCLRQLLLIAVLVSFARSAVAACGDGVVDAGEQCDAGSANGTDGCCSQSCTLVDSDYDGTCDALDPCNDQGGLRLKDATLTVSGLGTARSDDRLRFTGTMTIGNSPAIDPSASGVHLRMFGNWMDPMGTTVADVAVPGGARWTSRAGGTVWRYRDATGRHGGIRRIQLELLPPLVPSPYLTKVAFLIEAQRGSFPITPALVTSDPNSPFSGGSVLQVTLALGASASNQQCAAAYYTTVQPTHCTFSGSGKKVTCTGPPPVGPCNVGDPNDLVVCDILNAVQAEEAYFGQHGTYFSGTCSGLSTFTGSPRVSCHATGGATSFSVTTFHPRDRKSVV